MSNTTANTEPDAPSAVPEGYTPINNHYGFVKWVGPLYCKGSGEGEVIAVRVEERHCNGGNVAHGGMVSTMADIAIGYHLVRSGRPARWSLSLNLNMDFIGTAPMGSWLEARPRLRRVGSTVAFVDCELTAAGQLVASATSVLKLISDPGQRGVRLKTGRSDSGAG